MYPVPLRIGNFEITSLGVMVAVAQAIRGVMNRGPH